jgi:hypothetical protein
VDHLIKAHSPMAMYEALKAEITAVGASTKASAATVEKMGLKIGYQSADILKLQPDMKAALKK